MLNCTFAHTITLFLTLILSIDVFGHSPRSSRFYTSVDGLRESWVNYVTVGSKGNLFITHGDVNSMSILDGYQVELIPSPGNSNRVIDNPFGQMFACDRAFSSSRIEGVQLFQNDHWERINIPEIQNQPVESQYNFLSLKENRVLILTSDRLVEFDIVTRQLETVVSSSELDIGSFVSFSHTQKSSVLIGGSIGIAKILNLDGDLLPKSEWVQCRTEPGSGMQNFRMMFEGLNGEFYGIADSTSDERTIAFLYNGTVIKDLFQGRPYPVVCVFPDPEEGFWVIRGNRESFVLQLHRNIVTTITHEHRVLTGSFKDAAVDNDGSFLIATSLGLARFSLDCWRVPPEVEHLENNFNTIYEDSSGRVWFISQNNLVLLEDGQWRFYPYPDTVVVSNDWTQALGMLTNGHLAIGIRGARILMFDPEAETFRFSHTPESRYCSFIAPKRDGKLWVYTTAGDDEFRLETFDGERYETFLDMGGNWEIYRPRYLIETEDGAVWLGGHGGKGLARYKDGEYKPFGPEEGYSGGGAFSILEVQPGVIWVGDRDTVVEYNGEGWKVIRDNLETVRSMIKSRDGSIWVASGNGVHRYDGSWVTISSMEGLPNAAVYEIYEDSRGNIWAGTTRGLCRYYPDADPYSPNTFLSEENVSRIAPEGEARIAFYGLDKWKTTFQERLLFSFRLNDGEWTPFADTKVASYNNLSPGQYRLEVRAMGRNWNMDPTPALHEFDVILPWYREPAFLLIVSVGGILILILLFYAFSRNIQLEQAVMERTADLVESNQNLRKEISERKLAEKEKKMLENQLINAQKLEALGRLSGGIAHDFNNLLSVIMGYCDIIKMQFNESASLQDDMTEISKAAERAKELTRQLLAFSRKQILQPKVINLNVIVQDIEKLLRRLIGEDIEIAVYLSDNLMSTKADPIQVEQVIMNLAANARDAMPNGGKLVIETSNRYLDEYYSEKHVTVAPGWYVMLALTDSGSGMDDETQAKVFEPFFTTKEMGKGTGLGLATVYGIVNQSGGHIWLYSELGKGTTFKVYFPKSDETEPISQQETVSSEDLTGSETILVAEDNDDLRQLVNLILTRGKYTVLMAANGEQAIQLAKEYDGKIDLLLTDVIMPKMSGRNLAEELMKELPNLRVIYMSGYTDNAIVHHGVLDEGLAFLQKPFTPDQLLTKIRNELNEA